jgi:hypothetical protein
MNYLCKSELAKSYCNKDLYIGGYKVEKDEPNFETDINNNYINEIFNLGLTVPLMYYSSSNDHKSTINNKYDNSVVNESLHNKLLGILTNKSYTKKNKCYIKKTRKNHVL